MISTLFAALLSAAISPAVAQVRVTGDAWVRDRLGIGTTSPTAAIDVVNSSVSTAGFQVSADWEIPYFSAASSGALGIGVSPTAKVDVWSYGDDGTIALELRNGNVYPATSDFQLVFGSSGTANLRHGIRSVHVSSAIGGGLDFVLWTPLVSTTSIGSLNVLSIVAMSTFSSFHVMPVGTPWFEVDVSNGVNTGQGVVHRGSEVAPSSRNLKTEVQYLDEAAESAAESDVLSLRHARFRYKSMRKGRLVTDRKQPLRRGLIMEDTPASVRGPQGTLVVDERLANAELAAKKLLRDLERLEMAVGR